MKCRKQQEMLWAMTVTQQAELTAEDAAWLQRYHMVRLRKELTFLERVGPSVDSALHDDLDEQRIICPTLAMMTEAYLLLNEALQRLGEDESLSEANSRLQSMLRKWVPVSPADYPPPVKEILLVTDAMAKAGYSFSERVEEMELRLEERQKKAGRPRFNGLSTFRAFDLHLDGKSSREIADALCPCPKRPHSSKSNCCRGFRDRIAELETDLRRCGLLGK